MVKTVRERYFVCVEDRETQAVCVYVYACGCACAHRREGDSLAKITRETDTRRHRKTNMRNNSE